MKRRDIDMIQCPTCLKAISLLDLDVSEPNKLTPEGNKLRTLYCRKCGFPILTLPVKALVFKQN